MGARKHRSQVVVPKPTGRRRAVELVKDVLIVVLTCSAIYLAARSQLYTGLTSSIWTSVAQVLGIDDAPVASAALPSRLVIQPAAIALCTGVDLGDGARERCGIQYDAATVDTAFDEVRRFLGEALAGAGIPRAVSQADWQDALQAPGVYVDLLGTVPLPSLVSWLGEGGSGSRLLEGAVRELALVDRGDETAVLYYINEDTGLYYASNTSVPVAGELTAALSSRRANGARFAFEAGQAYSALDPNVLLPAKTPTPVIYRATNPLSLGDKDQLNELQRRLSFRPAGYPTADGDGWINDTLHIYGNGTVIYDSRLQEDNRYSVSSLTSAVDTARGLAEGLVSLGQNKSAARLALMGVEQRPDHTWEIRFGYVLDGAVVELNGSTTVARFLVEENRISGYELQFRYYENTGEQTAPLLPEAQAAAAMEAMGYAGAELALCYTDDGSGSAMLHADWVAR